ncbi:MAG: antitoxin AF2212-like protein [Candidatus Kryptoniota bacterium]
MTRTVQAIYEDKVLKPLSPLEGLQDHQRVEVSVYVPPPKEGLSKLIGTLSAQEAEEMKATIDREFERIDNEW